MDCVHMLVSNLTTAYDRDPKACEVEALSVNVEIL